MKGSLYIHNDIYMCVIGSLCKNTWYYNGIYVCRSIQVNVDTFPGGGSLHENDIQINFSNKFL